MSLKLLACLVGVVHVNQGEPTTFPSYAVVGDGGFQSLNSGSNAVNWVASSANKSISAPANIPGQIHLDLERAGIIQNTYVDGPITNTCPYIVCHVHYIPFLITAHHCKHIFLYLYV